MVAALQAELEAQQKRLHKQQVRGAAAGRSGGGRRGWGPCALRGDARRVPGSHAVIHSCNHACMRPPATSGAGGAHRGGAAGHGGRAARRRGAAAAGGAPDRSAQVRRGDGGAGANVPRGAARTHARARLSRVVPAAAEPTRRITHQHCPSHAPGVDAHHTRPPRPPANPPTHPPPAGGQRRTAAARGSGRRSSASGCWTCARLWRLPPRAAPAAAPTAAAAAGTWRSFGGPRRARG